MTASRYVLPADRAIAEDGVKLWFQYRGEQGTYLEFQFPPKVTSDSRRLDWDVKKPVPGRDPWATAAGGTPRNFTLKVEYIVEDYDTTSGGQNLGIWGTMFGATDKWTPLRIKKNINLVRGYFTAWLDTTDGQAKFGARFKHTLITGFGEKGVRINGSSLEYDGPMISPNLNTSSTNSGSAYFPLKTILTIDISTMSSSDMDKPMELLGEFPPFPRFQDYWY